MPGINRYNLDCYTVLELHQPSDRTAPAHLRTAPDYPESSENIRNQFIKKIKTKHPRAPKKVLLDDINRKLVAAEANRKEKKRDTTQPKTEFPAENELHDISDQLDLLELSLKDEIQQKSLQKSQTLRDLPVEPHPVASKREQPMPQFNQLPKYEEDQFEEIYLAYQTLSDVRRRYRYDHRSGGYFEVEWPGCFVLLDAKKHKTAEDKKKQEEIAERRMYQLDQALAAATLTDKVLAGLSAFIYFMAVLVAGLILTAVASVVMVLSCIIAPLTTYCVPKQLTNKIGRALDLPENSSPPLKIRMLLACGIFVSAIVLLIPMLVGSFWAAGVNSNHAYHELAARGMNRRQKVVLAMCLAATLCAALIIICPPAGLAAAMGAGGALASGLGMASFTFGGFLAGASVTIATITGAVTGLWYGLNFLKEKCCKSSYTYPSLETLKKQGLYEEPESANKSSVSGEAKPVEERPAATTTETSKPTVFATLFSKFRGCAKTADLPVVHRYGEEKSQSPSFS